VTLNEARHPGVPVIHLSMACNHCADAPCAAACPALAYTRDPATGRVDLDPELCIGCRYCSWACPYDAPKFDAPNGVMTKCTFCGHRQDQGLAPACVELCPTGALGFGDLVGLPGVREAAGLPTTVPGPSIRFIPWKTETPAASDGRECREADSWSASRGASRGTRTYPGLRGFEPRPPSKISLRSEWPLLGFTLLAALAVAAFAASVLASWRLPLPAFLVPAVGAMALSSLHLGRKGRAWRAVLNLRRSWLSREVVLYSAFVGLACLSLLLPGRAALASAAALAGFAALFAMDRVYDVVRPARWRLLESADVLLTGLFLTAVLAAAFLPPNPPGGAYPRVVAVLAAAKLVLYADAKLGGRRSRWTWWSAVRVTGGFVVPAAMTVLDPGRWPAWWLAGAVLGELVDRGELYTELEVPTPRRAMASELERRLWGLKETGVR
jgi:ferredoxin